MTFDMKEYQRRYYQKNKAALDERHKAWDANHPEKRAEIRKKSYNKDIEKSRLCCRKSYRKHKYNFTTDWEHVEGYDRLLAVGLDINTMNNSWCVHHRFEDMGLSVVDLKEMNLYYNRPACELIIMTMSEHMKHHHKLRNNDR